MPTHSFRIVCIVLLMQFGVAAVVVAQDKPAKTAPVVTLNYDSATLTQVLADLSKATGYKTTIEPDLDGGQDLSLSVGKVTLDVGCALLAQAVDYELIVHHELRLIEVLERGDSSQHTRKVKIDLASVFKLYAEGRKVLEDDVESPEGVLSEYYDQFAETTLAVLGIELPDEIEGEESTVLACELTERDETALRELIRLLNATGGGRDSWLIQQAESWELLKSGKLTLKAEDKECPEILEKMCASLGVPFAVEHFASFSFAHQEITLDIGELPALDMLSVFLGRYDLDFLLLGNVLNIVANDVERGDCQHCGYAVYDIGVLIAQLVASDLRRELDLGGEILKEIGRGIAALTEFQWEDDVQMVGTHLIVVGDSRSQEVVETYLTALGWKK